VGILCPLRRAVKRIATTEDFVPSSE